MTNWVLDHSVKIRSVSLWLLSSTAATATATSDEEWTDGLIGSCCLRDSFPSNYIVEKDSKLFVSCWGCGAVISTGYRAAPVDFFFSHEKEGNDLWHSWKVDPFLQFSLLAEAVKEQPCVCLSVYVSVSPPPGLFQPSQASIIGANLKYSNYSEGSELKRKEAQEEGKDEALGSSLLFLLLLLPPFFLPSPPLLPLQLALGFGKK